MSRTHTDLSIVAVSVAPSPATSGTSIGVTDANAAYLPDVYPWYALIKPASSMPTRSNGEIVQVTAGSSSGGTTTYTIVRAQGVPVTTARSIIVGDEILEVHAAQHQANIDATQNSSMSRQALINGNFDVWQRGTSLANTTANSYTADRWFVDTATAGDDKTVSQQTSDVNGSKFSCRVQRLAGETGHTVLRLSQALESQDSIKLRGKKLTLSFYLKVGANFSATSNVFTAKILTGTGTDEKATAFTGSADAATVDITATTTSTKYTLTTSAVIGATVTQVGVTFSYDPTGTAGANDWFELNQVQLCAGDVALPFQPKSFEEELRACQRYYEKSYDYGVAPLTGGSTTGCEFIYSAANTIANNHSYANVRFKVVKRAIPGTITVYPITTPANTARISNADATDLGANSGVKVGDSDKGFRIYNGSGGVITPASGGFIFHWTADAEL